MYSNAGAAREMPRRLDQAVVQAFRQHRAGPTKVAVDLFRYFETTGLKFAVLSANSGTELPPKLLIKAKLPPIC